MEKMRWKKVFHPSMSHNCQHTTQIQSIIEIREVDMEMNYVDGQTLGSALCMSFMGIVTRKQLSFETLINLWDLIPRSPNYGA
jgi:hypothetical protein